MLDGVRLVTAPNSGVIGQVHDHTHICVSAAVLEKDHLFGAFEHSSWEQGGLVDTCPWPCTRCPQELCLPNKTCEWTWICCWNSCTITRGEAGCNMSYPTAHIAPCYLVQNLNALPG